MNNLFVYGTLMLPEVSQKIFGQSSDERACLEHYQSIKIHFGEEELFYPALIEQFGAKTNGILFRNLSEDELIFIDEYEGDEYERKLVQVEANSEKIEAWCYIWKSDNAYKLKGNWNIDWFKQNFLDDFLKNRL